MSEQTITNVQSWQDIIVDLGMGFSCAYKIGLSIGGVSTIVYAGEAYRRPNETHIIVRLNDVMKAIRTEDFPITSKKTDYIDTGDNPVYTVIVGGASVAKYRVCYNWSYNAPSSITSAPVVSVVDRRQPLLVSINTSEMRSLVAKVTDGNSTGTYTLVADPASASETGTAIIDLSKFADPKAVRFELSKTGTTKVASYTVTRSCARFALYYVNERGGWDSLLLHGNVIETDDYDRKTTVRDCLNDKTTNRGRVDYLTTITKSFRLHTGILPKGAGERMHEVIGSPNVILRDLETGRNWAVNIEDKKCSYKTYKNNGAQLVEWTLDVVFAQKRYRK